MLPESPLLSDSPPSPERPPELEVRHIVHAHRVQLIVVAVGAVVLLVGGVLATWKVMLRTGGSTSAMKTPAKKQSGASAYEGHAVSLDSRKNYGNRYVNGLLPVGDKQYSTTAPRKGLVYLCRANTGEQGGAGSRGPWFSADGKSWDINKKGRVRGAVKWTSSMSNMIAGDSRTIKTNSLPTHTTGVFPIQATDPMYVYDRNPSKIAAQSLTYSLPMAPQQLDKPACMGGEAGVMLTGVPLFNAFDAGLRDAGAWEAQDDCDGHPMNKGEYHYHTLSRCITDVSVHTVIGFALDGFPITGPKVGNNNFLTTDNLDECHGLRSEVLLDGKHVTTYHYVMTQDFPYSVSCFRGKAIQAPGVAGPAGGVMPPPPPPPGQQPLR